MGVATSDHCKRSDRPVVMQLDDTIWKVLVIPSEANCFASKQSWSSCGLQLTAPVWYPIQEVVSEVAGCGWTLQRAKLVIKITNRFRIVFVMELIQLGTNYQLETAFFILWQSNVHCRRVRLELASSLTPLTRSIAERHHLHSLDGWSDYLHRYSMQWPFIREIRDLERVNWVYTLHQARFPPGWMPRNGNVQRTGARALSRICFPFQPPVHWSLNSRPLVKPIHLREIIIESHFPSCQWYNCHVTFSAI